MRSGFFYNGCTPGETRTPDTRLRKPLLYPAELQGRFCFLKRLKLLKSSNEYKFKRGINPVLIGKHVP